MGARAWRLISELHGHLTTSGFRNIFMVVVTLFLLLGWDGDRYIFFMISRHRFAVIYFVQDYLFVQQ
jgi:hypothetical protein